MALRLRLDRWYLGLHGLALLKSYPFGDLAEVEARLDAMRSLLAGDGPRETFETREVHQLAVDDAYEAWPATYDEPNPLIATEERVLFETLDMLNTGEALDVATGTGRVAEYLLRRGHRVVACDRSAGMVRRTSQKLPDAQVVRADALRLPVRDGSIDLVTCSLALTHLPDLTPVFESFARVLCPGGVALISEIHPFAVLTGGHAFFRLEDRSRAVTRNLQHWMSDYISSALMSGFSVQACAEAFVDEETLTDIGVTDDPLDPERALLGLPFAIIWTFRKTGPPDK